MHHTVRCIYGACMVHVLCMYGACIVLVWCIFGIFYGANCLLCRCYVFFLSLVIFMGDIVGSTSFVVVVLVIAAELPLFNVASSVVFCVTIVAIVFIILIFLFL